MPRKARSARAGALYHISHTCIQGTNAFRTPNDYKEFQLLLRDKQKEHAVTVPGLCLLPDGFHLLARPEDAGGLGRMMRDLLTTQVQRYRSRYGHQGALWHGRYRSVEVEQGPAADQVLALLRTLPVRRGLVTGEERWPWLRTEPSHSPAPNTERFVELCLRMPVPAGRPDWMLRAAADRLGSRPRGRPRREAVAAN
ncbi:MAG TPA: transposase [Azospirillaceae bacterium]|nr:transposase [Azospirillaceae bacterium]